MNELTLDGKTYVSSKRAAEITGYAKDYVGQLCREGHVEARLVGRNWYVLESSIRDHRFGKEATPSVSQETDRSGAASEWESPRYEAEKPSYIAPLSERMSLNELKNDLEIADEREIVPKAPVVTDMQSAWQEWFTRKEEIVLESAPIVEEPEEEVVRHEPEEETVPIAVYREEVALDLREEEPEEESFIVSERLVEPYPRGRNLILQSVFVAIALVAVAVTAIGSGFATKYTPLGAYRLSAIDYLAGTSSDNN